MPAPKKNVVTKIVGKGAEKILTKMGKVAVKSNAKLAAKEAAYIAKLPQKAAAAKVTAAKKDAAATLRNAGKAGSPLTAKVVVGPKTRAKMAEGKFGSKVKTTTPPVVKAQPNPNVTVKSSVSRDPFAGMNKPKKKK